MGCHKVPETCPCLLIIKDHIFNMKYFFGNPVDHITIRLIFFIIIYCCHDIIRIPQPVLIPCQIITKDRTMCSHGITLVGFFQFFSLRIHTADIPRNLMILRKLIILDFIGNLIRNDFPAFASVIRYGIRIKITDILSTLFHILECLFQKLVHQPHVGIFRVGSHTGKTTHRISLTKDPCMHRINCHLRNQGIIIKPSYNICLFHGRKFGTDNFSLLPSNGAQLLLGYLKYITKKCIVLLHVFTAYGFHFEILFVIHVFFPFCLMPVASNTFNTNKSHPSVEGWDFILHI